VRPGRLDDVAQHGGGGGVTEITERPTGAGCSAAWSATRSPTAQHQPNSSTYQRHIRPVQNRLRLGAVRRFGRSLRTL
jgi:hypothetical protein